MMETFLVLKEDLLIIKELHLINNFLQVQLLIKSKIIKQILKCKMKKKNLLCLISFLNNTTYKISSKIFRQKKKTHNIIKMTNTTMKMFFKSQSIFLINE